MNILNKYFELNMTLEKNYKSIVGPKEFLLLH